MHAINPPYPLLILLLVWFATAVAPAPLAAEGAEWLVQTPAGEERVRLYVFWSRQCPHCVEAKEFWEGLREREPWLEIQDFELTSDRANVTRYVELARSLGQEARSVPAFFVCGQMLTGFDRPEGMGERVLGLARFCRQAAGASVPSERPPAPARIELPLIGSVAVGELSLPVLTLAMAGLDAFNPCAFFVLLFLLSLMVHARSRSRMLLIGGTFVLFSGLVYFLFMAAWLNLFLVVGGAPVVTLVAGAIAVAIGALNVKDYFRFHQGPSLAIPESAKPGLFRRMRGLVSADHLGAMLLGTVALALAANSYELLCTAGFPMVYTRALTLNDLPPAAYYGYLAFYNLVYVLPLLAIVLVFTFTLGARKLSEAQGRVLKLLSGLMMLGLGLVMLARPELLSSPLVGVTLLGVALVVTGLLALAGHGKPARS
jgi:glutaredoxin